MLTPMAPFLGMVGVAIAETLVDKPASFSLKFGPFASARAPRSRLGRRPSMIDSCQRSHTPQRLTMRWRPNKMFWVYVTTIPLTMLIVANLIAAWTEKSTRRKWWLSAVAIILLERIVTFSYFIPTVIGLTSSELPEAEIMADLSQWLLFNHGRHVLTISGWLLALKALSLSRELSDR